MRIANFALPLGVATAVKGSKERGVKTRAGSHLYRIDSTRAALRQARSHGRASYFFTGSLIRDRWIWSSSEVSSSGEVIWLNLSRTALTSSLRLSLR
jgi:hypothetical protein